MLGGAVVEQYVGRRAGRARDALRHPGIVLRHDVGSARADRVGLQERLHEVDQPGGIDANVGVGVGDDGAGGTSAALRPAQSAVRGIDDGHTGVTPGDFAGRVGRAVVDDDDLVVGVIQLRDRAQTLVEGLGGVAGTDQNGDLRPPAAQPGREAGVRELEGRVGQGRLGAALFVGQPEPPVVDRVAPAPPVVGPRERDRTAGTPLERDADLRRGEQRLALFALAQAVGAPFGQQQRTVAGHDLQVREVVTKVLAAVQVDVERADVEERKIEVVRRRVVDVGEQRLGRGLLHVVVHVPQKPLDSGRAVPANDTGRDLVADRDEQGRRMAGQPTYLPDDLLAHRAGELAIVEKRDMLRPRNARRDVQSLPRRRIQQLVPRHGVGPYRVDAGPGHQREVLDDPRQRRKLIAVRVGRERAVRHALDQEALRPDLEELADHTRSRRRGVLG